MKQTAVEWLDEQIQERVIAQDIVVRKMIIEISMEDYIEIKKQAKEMEKQQTEISDDEINNVANRLGISTIPMAYFIDGAKWYREQLKSRQ